MRLARLLAAVLLATPLYPQRGEDARPRLSRGPQQAPAAESVARTSGVLTKIDNASVVIDAPDGRTLDCKRSSQTRFHKDSREIQASDLHPGDQVTVETSQDGKGYLHARSVYLEKATVQAQAGNAPATVVGEDVHLERPALRRGIPRGKQAAGADDEAAVAAEPAPAAPVPAPDPVLVKARAAADSFAESLPNYICREFMTRYTSVSRPLKWVAWDIVSVDVVYQDGAERYANVQIDGKPANKELEQLEGAWSTGEFGSVLRNLFSPRTAAEFRFARYSTASGFDARVYDFTVERANSRWLVQVASQSVRPAYQGSVWIEPRTGRVLRIEMQAQSLPEAFPVDTVESAVDYAYVQIGEGRFLLPSHAESLACERGSSICSRNSIDFLAYRKFEADSRITY